MERKSVRAPLRKLAVVGVMGAVAVVLMNTLEFPLPFFPPFLKLDFSSVPVLITSFLYGPLAGVAVALVKALVHLLMTSTAGVGELADFLLTAAMALAAGWVYRAHKTKKGALLACLAAVVALVAVGALTNYFILLPFYAAAFMPMEVILSVCAAVNPAITSVAGYIWFAAIPFNLLKGSLVAGITFLLYKRLSSALRRFTG